MSCYSSPYGQPIPIVNRMAPIQEVNPRLLEEAMRQIQAAQQPPMSQSNGVQITQASPSGVIYEDQVPQDFINTRAFNDGMTRQNMIAQEAANVLRRELGQAGNPYNIGTHYRSYRAY